MGSSFCVTRLTSSSNVKRTKSSIIRETLSPKKAFPVNVIPRKATGINIHGNIKDVHPVKMREENKADQNRGKTIATNEDSDDDFDFVPLNIRKQNMKKRRGPKKDQKRPMREKYVIKLCLQDDLISNDLLHMKYSIPTKLKFKPKEML
ncbi:hypothetical protein LXL04_021133 [Taraxacum kok-saghyz]